MMAQRQRYTDCRSEDSRHRFKDSRLDLTGKDTNFTSNDARLHTDLSLFTSPVRVTG